MKQRSCTQIHIRMISDFLAMASVISVVKASKLSGVSSL
jgi:hypothetical protein